VNDRRVLVVEDDQTLRDTVAEALGEDGYAVRTARDGQSALACVKRWPPDLVILDLMMPRLDGEGFCTALRRLEGMAEVPIIVVSASRSADEIGARVGANVTLPKPFDLLELTHYVDELVS
jgi:two-component system response regulator MprA